MRTKMIYPKLRAVMAYENCTIKELSEKTGINKESLSEKLLGKRKFTVEEALKVKKAVATDMNFEELFSKE